MEALFKVGECVKLYNANKADLIYLKNNRVVLLADIMCRLQVFRIQCCFIWHILNFFRLLSVKWRQ